MKKSEVVDAILKELIPIDYSDWNKDKDGFDCPIYREDSGKFKCQLRSKRLSKNIELVLIHDNLEIFVAKFNKNDKRNRVVEVFNELRKCFKENLEKERLFVLDRFLNNP